MPYEIIEIVPPPVPNDTQVLFVPDWTPGNTSNANGHLGTQYPYINIPDIVHFTYGFIGVQQYHWRMADYTDDPGIPAQGVNLPHDNPASLFVNHAVVRVWASQYFDPSYGEPYTSHQQLDDAFSAFGRWYGWGSGTPGILVDEGAVNLDLDGINGVEPGNFVVTNAIIIKLNPPGIDTQLNATDLLR